jgi:putative membrane protein
VAPQSGSYRDVSLLTGIVVGLTVLLTAIYGPFVVSDQWLIVDVLVLGGLAVWTTGRLNPVVRWLTTHVRRQQQVELGAQQNFVTHCVSATKERTGVLVYTSVLEEAIWVLPDFGAEGAAPESEWAALRRLGAEHPGDLPARLLAVLEQLKPLSERYIPRDVDDVNELPDAPSIG